MKTVLLTGFLTPVSYCIRCPLRPLLLKTAVAASSCATSLHLAANEISESELNFTDGGHETSSSLQKFAVPFTLLSALAIAISYADRANLSTAIIPMASNFGWDATFSGFVLSSFWAGYALTQIIGGQLADKFGGEKLLVAALFLWSFCTGITPWAASLGRIPVILVRVFLGVGEGMALPAVHSMIQKYVSPKDRSTTASIVTAACYLGSLFSNYFSPLIIEKFGWESNFHLFSVLPTVLWLPLWLLLMRSLQETRSETAKSPDPTTESITSGTSVSRATAPSEKKVSITYLLKQSPVLAIVAAQYGQSWGQIGLLSWLPTYFSEKFQVPVAELGSFTVLPYFLQMIVASVAGFVADRLIREGIPRIKVRNILQSIGMAVPALCLGLCAWIPQITAQQAFALISVGSALNAFTSGAVSCLQFDISRKNAGTIFGIGNTAGCIGGLIAVPISGYLFEQTHSWNAIFLVFAFHYLLGNTLWLWLASDRVIDA